MCLREEGAENHLLLGLGHKSLMYVSAFFFTVGTFWLLSAGTIVPQRSKKEALKE